ncbi:nucleoside-diphosphate kinase [Sphaerisporangium corydalis]|uniref:Nucleoside-diphosphate kinase n=1 Tax=Sphaerisporangium corydalis TaxID=1441875 RepID=A0ABV9EGT5_9ACTN|nr:nucleoside-diphosphate kinase [Sphaerisporangium corydalis]
MALANASTSADPWVPAHLSRLVEKRALYAVDTYFRESLEDLTATAALVSADSVASADSVERFCRDHALLLLKPDAVATRRLGQALRWVTTRGFSIVGAATVTMNRHAIRALWQYGLNAATRDRRDAADLYVTASDCMLVLLALPGRPEPATLVLSRLKGPADPADCGPGQLRHELGAVNYQLNLVHTADEPADLVRELGVLCDHETRTTLYRRAFTLRDATSDAQGTADTASAAHIMADAASDAHIMADAASAAHVMADAASDAYAMAERLEAATPAADLSLDRTLEHLAGLAATVRRTDPDRRSRSRELSALITRVREGRSRDWRRLLALAGEAGVPVTRWQRVILATYLLDPHVPGAAGLLPDASTGT